MKDPTIESQIKKFIPSRPFLWLWAYGPDDSEVVTRLPGVPYVVPGNNQLLLALNVAPNEDGSIGILQASLDRQDESSNAEYAVPLEVVVEMCRILKESWQKMEPFCTALIAAHRLVSSDPELSRYVAPDTSTRLLVDVELTETHDLPPDYEVKVFGFESKDNLDEFDWEINTATPHSELPALLKAKVLELCQPISPSRY